MATYSPLVDRVMHTHKSESRRGRKVSRVIGHHWAGVHGGVERLVHSSDAASANYIILSVDGKWGKAGDIIGSVPEERRAWTSGSLAADAPSITIEVQNSSTGGDWPVSAAALRSLVALIADIADRHGWGALGNIHFRGHREFAATSCPGPYLWSRRSQIVRDAQAARGSKAPAQPAPSKPSTGGYKGDSIVDYLASIGQPSSFAYRANLARQHGIRNYSGTAKQNLKLLDKLRKGKTPKPAPKPKRKNTSSYTGGSIVDYLTSIGQDSSYSNRARLARKHGITGYSGTAAQNTRLLNILRGGSGGGVSVKAMADEVIRGDHGNGHEARRRSLGISAAQYAEVRAEVNRRAG